MAPSATTWDPLTGSTSPVNSPAEGDINNFTNGNNDLHTTSHTTLYTDAYTHGYTDGYIKAVEEPPKTKQMPIAIVGMSCRLPGNVTTPDEFWELCSRARTGWSEIPKERFENASFHHPNPGKTGCFNAIGGNFLKEDLGLFDAPFFSLTEMEAISMCPQQRLLLECTFEALDSAGIPKHEIVGKEMGVFIGGSFSEYESQLFSDTETLPMFQATGCAFAMQSNRISHFFDLRGPSFTMDTACSSSLVALHQACQSLRNGESKSALVGGCHLNMLPEFWISMSNSRLFSDEGRSFSFDSRGTGYGRGEGCGMIVLKPLDQALKDNDNIRSVIVGSGINQDGKTPGITMPNGAAQESLIRSVYQIAGLDPKETGYVEAHGTGTRIGDPIEAEALHKVFGEGRNARNPLFIGSVKSNIGHLEAASGIISVIKTAMMLERGFILPNFDFKKPNEKIPFSKWGLKVPISQRPWPRGMKYASVNNFGFGGTNAHVVMEKAPFLKENDATPEESSIQARKLFVLSANDKTALESIMKKVGIYLEQRPEIFQNDLMSNIAYTLGQRRSLMQWRVAIPTTSSFDLIQTLNSGKIVPARETETPRIGFIFTGQGAQWNAMGRELYTHYPVFAATLDRCNSCMNSFGATFSLIAELHKDVDSLVNEAYISQPACTAVQLALVDLLRAWGVRPTAVAGHSSGEIAASYAADILSLESCMAISYYRGMSSIELKRKYPDLRGTMMAVGCSKEEIEPLIDDLTLGHVRIACYNSPSSLTISGDEAAIDELGKIMENRQMFNRKLQVDIAYHSHHMEKVSAFYQKLLNSLPPPKSTHVKFHSSLLGQLVDGTRLEPSYWVNNLTQAVRFSETVANMVEPAGEFKTGVNMLVEIGPHSALAGPIKQILKASGMNAAKIPYASALIRKRDAVETAQELAATLFVKGATLDLGAINLPRAGQQSTLLVDMPRYPWNHQTRYWHESRIMQKHKNRAAPRSDLLGTLANYSNELEPTWRNILRIDELPWLRHHRVQGLTLFPISAFVAMAVEAASQRATLRNTTYDCFELRDVSVNAPLMLTDDDVEITLQLRPNEGGSSCTWDEFRIHSWASAKGWTEHCKGFIALKSKSSQDFDADRLTRTFENSMRSIIEKTSNTETTHTSRAKIYDSLSKLGVSYGPSFQGMDECRANDKYSVARITSVDTAQEMPQACQSFSIIHPAFLEQLIEMYWPILGAGRNAIDTVYLPSSIGSMSIARSITEITKTPGDTLRAFCNAPRLPSHPKPFKVSMFAAVGNDSKEALLEIQDLTIAPILERDSDSEMDSHRELCYKLDWESILKPMTASEHSSTSQGTTNGDMPKFLTNGTITGAYKTFEDSNGFAIVHGASASQRELAQQLALSLENLTGQTPATGTLEDVDTTSKLCIFLAEFEVPFLSSISASQFSNLQNMLTNVQGVLWVVRGAYSNSSNPDLNMITGLSRSIRSEGTLLKFSTLDLDAETPLCQEATVKAILDIFTATLSSSAAANCELEFMERKGSFFTPRLIDDPEMNEYVHKHTKTNLLQSTLFRERPLQLVMGTPGVLETLHFTDQPSGDLLENEIEMKVAAIGMNRRDLTVAMGQLDTQDFGMECSGVVTRIGSKVTTFAVDDRIAGLSISRGVYSTYARVNSEFAFKISDGMPFESAATVPIPYSTAHYGLIDLGRLFKGERLLIHGASSDVGHAAVCLAQIIGAEIFATAENLATKTLIQREFGLRADHIFSSSNVSLISEATGVGFFDVVLHCTPSDQEATREMWKSMSNFGRFIDIACRDHATTLDSARFQMNKSFMSVDMISLASERPKRMAQLLSSVSRILNAGELVPIKPLIFDISETDAVFKALQHGNTNEKLVVVPKPASEVKATASIDGNKLLRPNATYILIGGTGGLGRSMARWMVEKGAKHIVLVSRSGNSTGKVKKLIDDLACVGAQIQVRRCDVANSESVKQLLSNELVDMPEIRGIVHGAMVLHDVLFEKMTHQQYVSVIESKVKGAWTFHDALRTQTLDFFVAISSAAGAVGNRGQAAYSAANTFLNAFVQHRIKLGLPASSLDLTAVSDSGYLAENLEAAAEVSKNLGSDTICEAEVLALLGAAIDGTLSRTCNNHTVTGMRITIPPPFWTTDAKFKHLRLAQETRSGSNTPSSVSFHALLRAATTTEEAQDVVCRGLLSKLPSVLMLEAEDMDITRSLSNYALDSLVAIEVRNFITREFEANLQVLELLSSGSIETLAKAICVKSKLISFT